MTRCPNCGHKNPEIANYCENCGQTLDRSQRGVPSAYAGAGATFTPSASTGAVRAVLRSVSTGKEYPLYCGGESLIGRGDPVRGLRPEVELSDGVARAKGVSRSHAKIVYDSGSFRVIDLNSANSTYLNGNRLTPQQAYELNDGDELKLGEYELTFRLLS
ncbi:MAG: FHA domain-containing protein [Actinobacteria bacterium]|nr:FHA domain-containing protein [Actinomycetota bacterium]